MKYGKYLRKPEKKPDPSIRLVIPFFVTMAILTVVSFLIPLRPTQSFSEKRELAKFPEFSLEALVSGDYFDDITLWFSDTFPGREGWMTVSNYTTLFHGYSDIAFDADIMISEEIPEEPDRSYEEDPDAGEETPEDDSVPGETGTEETEPEETTWGGIDAANPDEIALGSLVQIGDAAFNYSRFSSFESDRYIKSLNNLAQVLEGTGARVVSCPAPMGVSILVEPEYLEQLKCAKQSDVLEYLHSGMRDDVVKVDTVANLTAHNDEYIYFRTDHHWTALGAYYAYEAMCEALGKEAAPLSSFEEIDYGEFKGSNYGKVRWSHKLRLDNLFAYMPAGELTLMSYSSSGNNGRELHVLEPVGFREINSKYLVFISGDEPLIELTNASLPDAPNCLVVKDSYGNPFVPFLSQNYHKVYAIDYRQYGGQSISHLVEKYNIEDVIFCPYTNAIQSSLGNDFFRKLCK